MPFSGQLSQADCSLLHSFVNSLSLSSLGPSFPPPLSVSLGISPSGPLFGFHAKTDKEILWPAPTETEMNATYCVTLLPSLSLSFIHNKLQNIYLKKKKIYNTDIIVTMQGVTPFEQSPHCLFHKNTCNRGCSKKLQQNSNVLGWRAPSLPEITLKESFWPLSTYWSRRTVNLPTTFLFAGQGHYGLCS